MERSKQAFDGLEITFIAHSERGTVYRLGREGDQPEKVTDNFYPSRDYGFLWFRNVDKHLACSGLLHTEAISEERLQALVNHIAENLLGDDQKVDFQIEVVGRGVCRVESGEESLRFSEPLRSEVDQTPG